MAQLSSDPDDVVNLFNFQFFLTQHRAFNYIDRKNVQRLRNGLPFLAVFAREYSPNGKRYFIAEEMGKFYDKYTGMPAIMRTFYEIIRENNPCRLYFDLELCKKLNPDAEDEVMMDVFREFLVYQVKEILGIDLRKASPQNNP